MEAVGEGDELGPEVEGIVDATDVLIVERVWLLDEESVGWKAVVVAVAAAVAICGAIVVVAAEEGTAGGIEAVEIEEVEDDTTIFSANFHSRALPAEVEVFCIKLT
jgi:hypothetical protein